MMRRRDGNHGRSSGIATPGGGHLPAPCARPPRRSERGHLLVGLVVLIAVMLILLTAAAQSWTFLLRRDREAELIQRGEEYAKAIAFFQKESGSYPLRLDQLAEKGPHGHRFIRKLYPDPLAEDGEWGLLYLSPTGKGFVNPYATQLGDPQDPFASPVDTGFGKKKGNKSSNFQRHPSNPGGSHSPGYSEITPQQLKAMGGSNLPIVGVVHRKQEYGVKVYKGQASLNDWAFTIMAEGQAHNTGVGQQQPPTGGSRRPMGIGDHTMPIFLPGRLPRPDKPGKSNVREEMIKDYEAQQEAEERRRQEEEERRRQLLEEAGIDPDNPDGESVDDQDSPSEDESASGEDEDQGDDESDDSGEDGGADDGGDDSDPNIP